MLYRELGHRNANGGFEPPISLVEAERMPKAKFDVFRTLDHIYGKMELQWLDMMKQNNPDNKGKL